MPAAAGPDDDAREDAHRLDGGMMNTVFRHGGRVVRTATPASPASTPTCGPWPTPATGAPRSPSGCAGTAARS
ncbi:hypothetical protein HFP72_34425 [Nocardiopsis sp. ARC36]